MQHDFYGHMIPLVLAHTSQDAISACQMIPTASKIAPLHSLGQDDQNVVQHDFFII